MGNVIKFLQFSGVDVQSLLSTVNGLPFYLRELRQFKRQMRDQSFPIGRLFPCLNERQAASGDGRSIYFLQDLFVAQRVLANHPEVHIDVGSRVDGFVAHIASCRKVKVVDIRPLRNDLPNIEFVQVDMMGELQNHMKACCDSLSSLHAIEHFGLGRYGDPICWDGHIRGLGNLSRMLKPGGKLYFSVPIGIQRVEFNAHRVFSVQWLLEYFSRHFSIDQFSYIDKGVLNADVKLSAVDVLDNFGCMYGCGIFELTKK
jgi:SAM-dependent methyltransferase